MPNNNILEVHLPQGLIQEAKEKETHSTATINFIIEKALKDWVKERHSTVLYLEELPPWTDHPASSKPHPLDFADIALSIGWVTFTDFNYSNPVVILAASVPGITPRTAIEKRAELAELMAKHAAKKGDWVVKDNET